MSNTQSNHRNKRTACPRVIRATTQVALAHLVEQQPFKLWVAGSIPACNTSNLKVHGSRLKIVQAKFLQGSTLKVSKVVAVETPKSWFTSLGCSFPVGLVRLPVVGGLPL